MAWIDVALGRLSGVSNQQVENDRSAPPPPVVRAQRLPEVPQPVKVPRRVHRADARTYLHERDEILVRLSPHDWLTIEDCFGGIHCFGANGSGKTTGSGKTIAKAFLRAGLSGLVLCAKNSERGRWIEYARECGRSKQVIVFSEDGPYRFNFLDYELKRSGDLAGRVDNLVTTLLTLVDQAGRRSEGGDAFWQQAAEQLLRNCLMILIASKPNLSLLDVQKFIDAIPQNAKAVESPAWKTSEMALRLADARKAYEAEGRLADYEAIEHYLLIQVPALADRTRSSVTFTLSAMLQDLLVGSVRELFSTGTNVTLEDSFEGAVIIIDLPAVAKRSYAMAQTLFKIVWQQAALRRMKNLPDRARPLFLFADESSFFITRFDATFQSLAREARVASVFMTQNISAYRAKLGSQGGNDLTNAFLGLLQCHVFHAQSDPATIEHAQKLFGKLATTRTNINWSESSGGSYSTSWGSSTSHNFTAGATNANSSSSFGGGRNQGASRGWNESSSSGGSTSTTMEHALEARDFSALATGSDQAPRHLRGISQAYVFRLGRVWSNGETHLLAHFDRRLP